MYQPRPVLIENGDVEEVTEEEPTGTIEVDRANPGEPRGDEQGAAHTDDERDPSGYVRSRSPEFGDLLEGFPFNDDNAVMDDKASPDANVSFPAISHQIQLLAEHRFTSPKLNWYCWTVDGMHCLRKLRIRMASIPSLDALQNESS